jgi:Mitochondrial protein Pet127
LLWKNAKENNSKFIGSTSSVSSFVAQFYKLIGDRGKVNPGNYTKHLIENVNTKFSPFLHSGAKINLIYNDGVYGIESPSNNRTNYLMELGHVMELFLLKSPQEFSKYLKKTSSDVKTVPLVYHYAEVQKAFDD